MNGRNSARPSPSAHRLHRRRETPLTPENVRRLYPEPATPEDILVAAQLAEARADGLARELSRARRGYLYVGTSEAALPTLAAYYARLGWSVRMSDAGAVKVGAPTATRPPGLVED